MQDGVELVELLGRLGVDAEALAECAGSEGARIVVVQASLEDARKSLSDAARDHVIMARVNSETAQALDRWVDVGLAKSRSEAAALFMQEGLQMRAADLARLASAFDGLDEARQRLKREAAAVLGSETAGNLAAIPKRKGR